MGPEVSALYSLLSIPPCIENSSLPLISATDSTDSAQPYLVGRAVLSADQAL